MQQPLTATDFQSRLTELGNSPTDSGSLDMIVRRPESGEREVVQQADLHPNDGVVGDNWSTRGSSHTEDGNADPNRQITLMNSRVLRAIESQPSRWALAGDQLIVDLDLSIYNLQPGHQISIGTAILEITDIPHTGCANFTARFGHDAIRFVNSKEGRDMRRRGIYARVVQAGSIQVGDTVSKIVAEAD
jgi:MOSC domain-containing protein YiiM